MLYKRNEDSVLKIETFREPPCEYRGTPFWAWNCRVTKKLIKNQMEIFRKMGFGGVHIHSRTGLETEYMGKEFLKLVKYAEEVGKEKGMLCWLYDEDRYPSGAAGGIVTKNHSYRARHLLLSREKKKGMCESRDEFRRLVEQGKHPAGYYLTAYRVKTRQGYLESYEQIEEDAPEMVGPDEEQTGGLWFAYIEIMQESPWFNGQTYVDVLNKEAINRFIEATHEKYYQVLGEEFGASVPAIFTDEPQIRGSMTFLKGESNADVTLSFTDDFPDTYREAFGEDILSVLPELLWELPKGRKSVHRYRYHEHLTERFVSAFSDTIAEWCENHHIAMTGHYMSEPTLYSQTLRLGEAMRCYRHQQLPGVDILCGDPEYSTVKQAVSVARQNGREGVLSELYGVNHWDFDFKGHKLQGDWQAALGVTIRCHHLAFMSMEGEAKRDWPASISYQSPWWERYAYIEDYFSRINTALTRGRALTEIAVVHPIESYWMCYGPVKEAGGERGRLEENFDNIIRWLLFGLLDFDFLAESLLPEQETSVRKEAGRIYLQVGRMKYSTVIVPELITIRTETLRLLEEFARKGGRVIFLGGFPSYENGIKRKEETKIEWPCECVPYRKDCLLRALEEERRLKITDKEGREAGDLFYQMRQDTDCIWLFLCHTERERCSDQPKDLSVGIRGTYRVEEYDALSGEIRSLSVKSREGWTYAEKALYSEDSLLWKLIPAKETELMGEPDSVRNAMKIFKTLYEPDGFLLEEANVLLMDYAEWRLNDGEWQDREEILRLDNKIRALLGYPLRQDAYVQPWCVNEAPENDRVTLRYEIISEIEAAEVQLAMERPEKAMLTWNGMQVENRDQGWYVDSFIRTVLLPGLKKGKNHLLLEIPYGRKTNLENIYLLGDFGVEIRGTRGSITKRPQKLYFGDIGSQGLAFYSGNLVYEMEVILEREEVLALHVPHFAGAAMEVRLNGKRKGLIAFSPHIVNLGRMRAGKHRIQICLLGNRFNTFGTLHNCDKEFKWYGPDSYRTVGIQWSEGYATRPLGILSRVELLKKEEIHA